MNSGSPLLDSSAVNQLRQVAGDDSSLLNELFQLFESDAATLLAQLDEAMVNGDAAAIRQFAHALKGGAANVGAARLAAQCLNLETLARAETASLTPERRRELMQGLRVCCEESRRAIRSEFQMTVPS